MRLLIVEDDTAIATDLFDYLESRGHAPDAAADGVTGLHLALTADFDAIVLDVNMPRMDGLTFCRKLREQGRDTPVLMLTARDTLDDKLVGFAHGADDYLVKPFALKEVEARLQALHKRAAGKVVRRALAAGDIAFDPATLEVHVSGKAVRLPPKCLKLIELFLAQPGRVFSRQELELAVWGEAQFNSDPLRTQLHTLRRALAAAGAADPIENVHGLGYRFRPGGDA